MHDFESVSNGLLLSSKSLELFCSSKILFFTKGCLGDIPFQTVSADCDLRLYYTGENLMNFETLDSIRKLENQILATAEMQRSCLKIQVTT